MNKYLVTVPYDCIQYGKMSCYIYAENEADALDLAYESENRLSEEYEDGGQDGTNFDFDSAGIELNEEDVTPPIVHPVFNTPKYTPYEKL
ncbi:MAG: hypothetical protein JST55_17195, partial [Bacteroidetes bacterium]|nr:hypothetical protein [Bacteroidota bacterium]